MSKANILYIDPQQIKPEAINLISGFNRISNFLHSKKNKINGEVQEEFLKLDFENLPQFLPERIVEYRASLQKVLEKIYDRFNYNIVGISCYSLHQYSNTIEVASLIKHKIDRDCAIVIGGSHTSICPEDFSPGNLPKYLSKVYPPRTSPVDYLIKEEGEIPFYKLVKNTLNGNIKKRKNLSSIPITMKSEIITDLNDVPIIDFDLFRKYKKEIKELGRIIIDFIRGCPFSCNICVNSTDKIPCYKTIRFKSVERCLREISQIINTDWLTIEELMISDPTFFPKRTHRDKFYEGLKNLRKAQGKFPFRFLIWDRVDTCHLKLDLERFKDFDIEPYIGMESVSPRLLKVMGKVRAKENSFRRRAKNYIKKVEDLIIKSNELDTSLVMGLIIGCPGSTHTTFQENRDFFLKPRFNGKSLVQKYNVNIRFSKFLSYIGEKLYYEGESKYKSKIHCKQWWKKFDADQRVLAALVDPSEHFSLKTALDLNYQFIWNIFKEQIRRNNKAYSFMRLKSIKNYYDKIHQKKDEIDNMLYNNTRI